MIFKTPNILKPSFKIPNNFHSQKLYKKRWAYNTTNHLKFKKDNTSSTLNKVIKGYANNWLLIQRINETIRKMINYMALA